MLNLNKIYQQAVSNLLGQSENPCRLIGNYYNEETMLPLLCEAKNVNALAQIYLHKLIFCYVFFDYPQSVAHAAEAEKYMNGLTGTPGVPAFHLYDSLPGWL